VVGRLVVDFDPVALLVFVNPGKPIPANPTRRDPSSLLFSPPSTPSKVESMVAFASSLTLTFDLRVHWLWLPETLAKYLPQPVLGEIWQAPCEARVAVVRPAGRRGPLALHLSKDLGDG